MASICATITVNTISSTSFLSFPTFYFNKLSVFIAMIVINIHYYIYIAFRFPQLNRTLHDNGNEQKDRHKKNVNMNKHKKQN